MTSAPRPPAIDVTIAIATYDRPALLENALRSCLAQTNSLGLSIELLVIDNHPSENGRPVVDALAGCAPYPLRYLADPTRSMSALRNRGFAEARGELLAIIDDDEAADPDWLDVLVSTLRTTDADIAVGPRRAQFVDGAPPAYDPHGRQFVRDLRLPDGAFIALTAPSGKPRYGLGTGNSLFHLQRCFPGRAEAMRPEFGDAGGEDAELFVRLHRNGRRIVWAARAIVTETVPPHRTTPAYRLLRTRREAQHYASIYIDASPRPRTTWAILAAKGLAQCAAGAVIAAARGEWGSDRRLLGRMLIAHGVGKLTYRKPVGFIKEPSVGGRGSTPKS